MKFRLTIVMTATIVILISGCTENLELKPIAKPTEVSFYNDAASIDATLTATYAQLCAREVFDKDYYLVVGSFPCDDVEAGGETINDYPTAQHYDQFTYNKADITPILEIWQYCYKGIRMSNTTLEKLKLPLEDISDEFKNSKTAEAKFLRAFYHFTLVQVFGGIPIADKVLQPEEFYTPRNTIKEVLSFCEDDLKAASKYLPEIQDEAGRITRGAAQSLLGKVLLYESSYSKNYTNDLRFEGCEERWEESYNTFNSVIKSGKYKLVGMDGERYKSWRTFPDTSSYINAYRWLFTAEADNSSGSIFEIQNVNDGLGWGYSRGNNLTVYTTVRKYNKPSGGIADVGGWSFNCPTNYLVQAFGNSDPREKNLNSTPINPLDDPRYSTTIGQEGDSIIIYNKGLLKVEINVDHLPTKMIGRKFECGYDEYWKSGQVVQGPFNVRLIRFADVLLMAAESAYMINDKAKALELVNMVRTRARRSGNTGHPTNLSSISFEDIIHERRLELALEPFRFFDLVRWNLTDEFLNGISNFGLGDFKVEFVKGKHEFFPLPETEVQLSKGALKQYPEWQ